MATVILGHINNIVTILADHTGLETQFKLIYDEAVAESYQTIEYSELRGATVTAFRQWRRRLALYLISCLGLMLVLNLFNTDPINADWFIGFIAVYLIMLIVVGYIPFVRRRISLLAAYSPVSQAFANDNGFDFHSIKKPAYGLFRPALENLGLLSKEEQVISGVYGGYPIQIYVHTFRHPLAGRFSRVSTRVYQVTLPKRLPHIFLATRRGTGTTFKTNFMTHFDDDQRVDLEGDFNKNFVVYTHRRTATEALSILAPNVMATLLDTNENFNVEIIGDQLFLYSPDYLFVEDEVRNAFLVLEKLLKHLDHKLKSWRLVLPNDKKYPFLRSRPGYGTVTFGGKYFNASILAIVWFVGINLIRLRHSTFSPAVTRVEYVVLALIAVAAIYALLILRRKYKSSLIAQ